MHFPSCGRLRSPESFRPPHSHSLRVMTSSLLKSTIKTMKRSDEIKKLQDSEDIRSVKILSTLQIHNTIADFLLARLMLFCQFSVTSKVRTSTARIEGSDFLDPWLPCWRFSWN